ncbi:hypothetical protein, partial [Pacificibacter sp. AS14]|uniref:hypothetical protein n=1 Tax=Pacificibacter sp. AS14 TaxID=3135785 RepID=UPI003174B202
GKAPSHSNGKWPKRALGAAQKRDRSNMTSALSSLPRQEALFVGEAAALPARIKINSLSEDKLPDSNDISFAKAWSKDTPDDAFLDQICKNMQS